VVHQGVADGGHYYSFIQDRQTTKWYEFNDTFVNDFAESDLADECFGGAEQWGNSMNFRTTTHVKTRNAYLLFYERVNDYEPPKSEDEGEGEEDASMKDEISETIPEEIKDIITLDNQKYW
jgi:ubiquitin carboxyl-terminal hydrolase 9/24